MASIATANHLQISPVFTPNLFVLVDASHLSASPLPHWSPGNFTGGQPRLLLLCKCKTTAYTPATDRTTTGMCRAVPPAVHLHAPGPTPIPGLHCHAHKQREAVQP